jgi:hypothetical protein
MRTLQQPSGEVHMKRNGGHLSTAGINLPASQVSQPSGQYILQPPKPSGSVASANSVRFLTHRNDNKCLLFCGNLSWNKITIYNYIGLKETIYTLVGT